MARATTLSRAWRAPIRDLQAGPAHEAGPISGLVTPAASVTLTVPPAESAANTLRTLRKRLAVAATPAEGRP